MEEIDIIRVKQDLAKISELYRKEIRDLDTMIASDAKVLKEHREYWKQLRNRRIEMAEMVETFWKGIPNETD